MIPVGGSSRYNGGFGPIKALDELLREEVEYVAKFNLGVGCLWSVQSEDIGQAARGKGLDTSILARHDR